MTRTPLARSSICTLLIKCGLLVSCSNVKKNIPPSMVYMNIQVRALHVTQGRVHYEESRSVSFFIMCTNSVCWILIWVVPPTDV